MQEPSTFWNIRDDLKGLPYAEIVADQKANTQPFAACILDIDGNLNTATIIRSACSFGAEKTFVFGRRKIDRRGLVGAQNYVEIERVDGIISQDKLDYEKFHKLMEDNDYTPVYAETGGVDVNKKDWTALIKKPCFVFGNENSGIPKEFLTNAEHVVNVPMSTVMRSLNVSVAAGIVMHEYVNRFLRD